MILTGVAPVDFVIDMCQLPYGAESEHRHKPQSRF